MKKILIVCALFLPYLSQNLLATKQVGNIIYIDGQEWRMQTEPIGTDTVLFNEMLALLPKDRESSTANWLGYISYWSIQQEQLCLDSIRVSKYDKSTGKSHHECIPMKEMYRVFVDYVKGNRVIATWFTNGLKASRGKCLYYHPVQDFYEEETMLAIEQGRVTEKRTYHNSLFDGYSLEGNQGVKVIDIIKEKKLLHWDKYPELVGLTRIIFSIKNVQVNALGHMTDCILTARINLNDEWIAHPAIAEEMKRALMSLYPWKILCIDGKYLPCGIDGYTFSYIL